MESKSNDAGKGDKPRNCFSQQFRDNYAAINWNKKENKKDEKTVDNTINDN